MTDQQIKVREQKALFFNNMVLEAIRVLHVKRIILAGALYEINKNEYFREMNFETFDHYLWDNDLKPNVARRWVSIYEDLVINKKIKAEEVKDIDMSKLEIIRKSKDPKKWIDDARELKFLDLKERFNEKEKGIPPKDHIQEYIKRKKPSCPFWDPDAPAGKKCKQGINVSKK